MPDHPTTITAAPGWWLLLGQPGNWQRRPLVAWALLEDGTVRGVTDWLSVEPVVATEGLYRHDVDWLPCSCVMPEPHSGGFDPTFCIYCAGLTDE